MEHHHLIDTVDEFRSKMRFHFAHHRQFHHLVILIAHALYHLRA